MKEKPTALVFHKDTTPSDYVDYILTSEMHYMAGGRSGLATPSRDVYHHLMDTLGKKKGKEYWSEVIQEMESRIKTIPVYDKDLGCQIEGVDG